MSKQTTTSHKDHQSVNRLTHSCHRRWRKHRTKYNYDLAWRMTNIVSPAGKFVYSYNVQPASSLVSGISLTNSASIQNNYDPLGRITQTALVNQWGHTLDGYSYTLDGLGLRTGITRNLGLASSSVAVNYDAIGQITSWNASESSGLARMNEQLGFAYDAAHNLLLRTNNQLVETFTMDAANELTNVTSSGTLTLNGAVFPSTTNVTVNGQPAQIYGDLTYASTNLTLINGQNAFTNIAANAYDVKVTNTLAINLPQTVQLLYDSNGNLTNDGLRSFAYDSENELTNVTVAGQWRSDFIYDGMWRRRIARDYSWNGTGWVLTNEIHYIYNGYQIVQERDTNNNPFVAYTRGLDLGGDLEEAGGIGGLLARTDGNGSTLYHADANGNVTALMDGNENVVARYLYNPFGKVLGQWGVMANANEMQFSSMPQRDGLALYAFRGYEPNFQRWMNQDPISERGGVNLYGYVENNPVNLVDRFGLDFWIWIGAGPAYSNFYNNNNNSSISADGPSTAVGMGAAASMPVPENYPWEASLRIFRAAEISAVALAWEKWKQKCDSLPEDPKHVYFVPFALGVGSVSYYDPIGDQFINVPAINWDGENTPMLLWTTPMVQQDLQDRGLYGPPVLPPYSQQNLY